MGYSKSGNCTVFDKEFNYCLIEIFLIYTRWPAPQAELIPTVLQNCAAYCNEIAVLRADEETYLLVSDHWPESEPITRIYRWNVYRTFQPSVDRMVFRFAGLSFGVIPFGLISFIWEDYVSRQSFLEVVHSVFWSLVKKCKGKNA